MANIQSQSPISDSATGAALAGMFEAATNLLEQHVEEVNALNVFPVPDGDTGTNMFLTMQSGVEEINDTQAESVSEVATAMYRGTFMGARGNSGVILSQFLKGLADGFDGGTCCVVVLASQSRGAQRCPRPFWQPVRQT